MVNSIWRFHLSTCNSTRRAPILEWHIYTNQVQHSNQQVVHQAVSWQHSIECLTYTSNIRQRQQWHTELWNMPHAIFPQSWENGIISSVRLAPAEFGCVRLAGSTSHSQMFHSMWPVEYHLLFSRGSDKGFCRLICIFYCITLSSKCVYVS